MGNEQSNSSSHHFLSQQPVPKINGAAWTKNGRIPPSKQQQTSRPHWQLSRDASMDILSKKTTKLSFKRAPSPGVSSALKKPPGQESFLPEKPLQNYQTPRMPTDKEVSQITIAHQLLCAYCDGPCIGEYLRCRVCIKAYHNQCLFNRGHLRSLNFSLPRLGKQDWCCPECKDLTRVLRQDEMNSLIFLFEQMDRIKDGYISAEGYRYFYDVKNPGDQWKIFCKTNEDVEKHFRVMDSKQRGTIEWSDFILFYSCKLIANRSRAELATKLTQKELAFAKNLFLKDQKIQVDSEGNLIINKIHLDRVIYEMTLMLKKKYGGDFIDAVLEEFRDTNENLEKFSVFGWDEFLRQISLLILLNRSNYDVKSTTVSTRHFNPSTTIVDVETRKKTSLSRTEMINLTSSVDTTYDDAFRKHGKILEKLQLRNNERKKSVSQWSIVENLDENEDDDRLQLPRLKLDARDQRQTVTQPWVMVKEMQQLRNQPIRVQMLKV